MDTATKTLKVIDALNREANAVAWNMPRPFALDMSVNDLEQLIDQLAAEVTYNMTQAHTVTPTGQRLTERICHEVLTGWTLTNLGWQESVS